MTVIDIVGIATVSFVTFTIGATVGKFAAACWFGDD